MRFLILFLFFGLLFIIGACSQNSSEIISLTGRTMGTTYSIKYVNSSVQEDLVVQKYIDSTLQVVNQQMSTYIPDSEISQFNKFQDTVWFNVSLDLANVIRKSLELCKLSNGSLDITVGPLVNLWGFGPDNKPNKIPAETKIEEALNNIGWEKLEAKTNPASIKKTNPKIYCDLSATAKGFGVDKIASLLESLEINNYLVEIGGELSSNGFKQENIPWRVGISRPDDLGGIQEVISLRDACMATSGDYWNYFEEGGVRFSHTINPQSGKPITHKLASVTVIAKSCLEADGLATALDVMGEKLGFEFAKQNNICAYFIHRQDDQFVVNYTDSFTSFLNQN